MKLSPHINFGGQCEAAFQFYERCLGGKIGTMLTWGDSPMAKEVPPSWQGKIFHASLVVGDQELAGIDDPAEPPVRGFQLLVEVDLPEEADRLFEALADKGTVKMKMAETFWSPRFGVLVDAFGVTWEIHCRPIP